MTDRELLNRYVREGSHEAFAEIVRRHTDLVYATCLRILRNGHDAEDAAQAAFLVFMKKAHSIPADTALSGWLFRVAENCARNIQTIAKRRQRNESEAAMAGKADELDATLQDEACVHLDAALSSLSAPQRDAIVLRYLLGKSQAEAALELGCPAETLHTRVTRALEKLREKLSRKDVRLSVALLILLLERCREQSAPAGLSSSIHTACLAKAGVSGAAALAAKEVLTTMMISKIKVVAAGLAAAILLGIIFFDSKPIDKHMMIQAQPPATAAAAKPQPVVAWGVPVAAQQPAPPTKKAPAANPNLKPGNEVDHGLEWLAKAQEEDGHYDSVRHGGAKGQDVAVTSLSLLAFLGAGHTANLGSYKETNKKAVAWLKEHGSTDVTQAALRVLALAEHFGMSRLDKETAQAALDDLVSRQSPNGTWEDDSKAAGYQRKIGPTTWAFLAMRSAKVAGLKVSSTSYNNVIASFDSQQSEALTNGGNTTGAFMAAGIALQRQFGGFQKDGPEIQQMVTMLPPQRPTFPAEGIGDEAIFWHHGTCACFQNGGPMWKEWNESMRNALLPSQIKTGEFAGSWNYRADSNPFIWGRIGSTALATLCLEVYYRYLQMYPDQTISTEHKQSPDDNGVDKDF